METSPPGALLVSVAKFRCGAEANTPSLAKARVTVEALMASLKRRDFDQARFWGIRVEMVENRSLTVAALIGVPRVCREFQSHDPIRL